MKGKTLRGQLDDFDDVLDEIETFFKEKNINDRRNVLSRARNHLDSLFYLIPLEEDENEMVR